MMKAQVVAWLLLPALGPAGAWLGKTGDDGAGKRALAVREVVGEKPHDLRCAGGMDPDLEVLVEPAAIVKKGRGEVLQVDLGFKNGRSKPTRLLASAELIDSKGRRHKVELDERPAVIEPGQVSKRRGFETPETLEDGYYRLKVNAAQRSEDGDEDSAQGVLYVRIKGGSILPIDVNDYFAESDANAGIEGVEQ